MKQIIAVTAIKGGTGKSTTATAFLQAAVKDGRKVLAIDLDPQACMTYILAGDPRHQGAYELITGRADISSTIQPTPGGIDLISGSANLTALKGGQGSARRLESSLESVKNKYGLAVIDTAPAMSEALNNALFACTGAIIPLEASVLSLQALYQTIDIITHVQEIKPGLKVLGTMITQYDGRSNFNKFILDQVKEASAAADIPFLGTVRKGIAVSEAEGMRQSLFDYAPKSNPAKDYLEIYRKVIR